MVSAYASGSLSSTAWLTWNADRADVRATAAPALFDVRWAATVQNLEVIDRRLVAALPFQRAA